MPPHAPPGDATELSSDNVHARWGTGHCGDRNYAFRYSSAGHKEGSPWETEWVGVAWMEFVTTSW